MSQSDLRFYHSVFPLCDGMEGGKEDWSYDLHPHGQFVLNADYQQEYVLHVRNGEKQVGRTSKYLFSKNKFTITFGN